MDLNLPSEEDTRINLTFPDGSKLSVDAVDIDLLVMKCHPIPEDSNFITEFARQLKHAYGKNFSKAAANLIYDTKVTLLNTVKKNSSPLLEQLDSTEQEPYPSAPEPSDSSS